MEVTRDLAIKLGVPERSPPTITWVGEAYDADKPAFLRNKTLGLRKELRGILTAQEWKPLLASSLVLYTRMNRARLLLDLIPFSLSLALSGFISFLLRYSPIAFVLFQPRGPIISASWIVFLFAGTFWLVGALTGPFRRNLTFRADETVSSVLGMQNELLQSLKKIDEMSHVQKKRFGNPLRKATTSQRILKLSGSVEVQQAQ